MSNNAIFRLFIKKSTRCNSISKFFIPYLYEAQHVSGDTPPIIRSLKLHWQPLVFHTWKVVGRVVGGRCQAHCAGQRPPIIRLTTFHVCKTRGCQCSFRLLMMGGVSSTVCLTKSTNHTSINLPRTKNQRLPVQF
jgi:hypothetical protein